MSKLFKVTTSSTTYTHYWVKADNEEQAVENVEEFERCEDDPQYGDNNEEVLNVAEVDDSQY